MAELNTSNNILGSNYLIFLMAVYVRWCVALHSYSGEKTPPKFGDYEAQRHWMEVTYNLQLQDWYKNTTDNDLEYWGLDYPPLTAYHSYICSLIFAHIIPDSVQLNSSRGYESYEHKLLMRYTVLISDLLFYIPAIICYFRIYQKQKELLPSNLCILFTLFYPGLILIDYGHFQYNCVSLGFFVSSVMLILIQYFKTASIFFCLALNYKQMELYHSLPFFFFFLGKFFLLVRKKKKSLALKFITQIGVVVLSTFLIIWSPFLLNISYAKQVLNRIFPVERGVFEDKEILDESNCNCGLKFKVLVVSDDFEGKPLIQRHRMVNSILEEELKKIHAFSQETLTVEQWKRKRNN